MRLSLRFILPLGIALAAIAYAVVPVVDRLALQWFVRDLDDRSAIVARGLNERLVELLREPSGGSVVGLFERTVREERVFALGLCTPQGTLAYASGRYPRQVDCARALALTDDHILALAEGPVHVEVTPLEGGADRLGSLVVMHDVSFIERRSAETRMYLVYLFAAIGAVVALITVVIAELSWRGWVAGFKALVSGAGSDDEDGKTRVPELRPIEADLKALVRDLEAEHSTREDSHTVWAPDALRRILREELKGDEILIVSNREPYLHVRREGNVVEIQRPASGLVTALEPVMRACSGTWIAHGAGSADREAVDQYDRVMVPPDKPSYRIRRVWLSKEEEQGYYYGFANEGLWPLCHIAHARPVFRVDDFEQYRAVNQRFADVVVDEARSEDPIVLVQDYHFALAPRMIRERLPRATIITFWHIPWPNPEVFGILPWREEVLEGMLGSSILGFHTQFHCNNFFDTVDRFLEARVDRETFTISYGGEPTEVRRYPISIEWPPAALVHQPPVEECRRRVRERLSLAPDTLLGVGVDRLDYTKGIAQRLRAYGELLDEDRVSAEDTVMIQIAEPSRTNVNGYAEIRSEVEQLVGEINGKYGTMTRPAVHYIHRSHDFRELIALYRLADVMLVTPFRDGMNLVAKEYVATRYDDTGALVLSEFAGAVHELELAVQVNPYDTDGLKLAIEYAIQMPSGEQTERMAAMRAIVAESTAHTWAESFIAELERE